MMPTTFPFSRGTTEGSPEPSPSVFRGLSEEEVEIFRGYWQALHSEFPLNASSDRMCAELACLYHVHLQRAMQAGKSEVIDTFDKLLRGQLTMLKAGRITREGASLTPSGASGSPSEWAIGLLVRAKAGSGSVDDVEDGK